MTPKFLGAIVVGLVLTCLGLLWWIAALQPAIAPVAWGVTALMAAGVAITIIVRRLRARRAARGIEAGLREQARARQRVVRPDQHPELGQMQEDFERAIKALKSSRIGRAGRDALYFLPWYVIIGPSGAGKSTALRNSGLRFPNVMPGDDPKVKGIGGTRNCDFWLSNDAVLLDTAGRWSTEAEDKDEWLQFLRLLQKNRSRKPLNGVITAISVGDIVNARPDDVEALALRMRERIDELLTELRVSLPVYVVFTKCDLIQGFVDMFGALHASEREQVWGFTLPLSDAGAAEPERRFEQEFDVLDRTLHAAALGRLGVENQLTARQRIFEFPQQFRAMRGSLSRFVSVLLHRSVYHEPASLRGVYFSSGTQEGRPFSLLQGARLETESRVDQKSYFLRNLFMDVIFGDSDLAAASPAELRRRRYIRLAAMSALGIASAAILTVPSCAFFRESDRLASTTALAQSWQRRFLAADEHSVRAEPSELAPVLDDLRGYEQPPSWIGTLGMSEVERVKPVLRTHHHALMQRWVVRPIASADVPAMNVFGLQYAAQPDALPNAQEHKRLYDMLKQHLLLSARQLTSDHAEWLAQYLGKRLREHESRGGGAAAQVARTFVQLIPDQRVPTVTVDTDVVQRVRAALTRSSIAQHALEVLIAELEPAGYDLTLASILGRSSYIRDTKVVRGAFTRRGWDEKVRARLPELAKTQVGELWVLGLSKDSSAAKQAVDGLQELGALYQRSYVEEWSAFLHGIEVRAPETSPEALALLAELTSGQPTPYGRLFEALDFNSRLELEARERSAAVTVKDSLEKFFGADEPETATSAATDVPLARTVRTALEPVTGFGVPPEVQPNAPNAARASVPLDQYLEQLHYVREALQMQLNTPTDRGEPDARLQTAHARVRALIDVQDAKWRPAFERLLWPPLQASAASWSGDQARRSGAGWCSAVAGPFGRALRGRYPFVKGASDAALDDFDAFYRPDGSLWGFVSSTLGGVVTREGTRFKAVQRLGDAGASAYSRSVLPFLEQSHRITSTFYPLGSKAPRIDFQVRIKPTPWIARTALSVGGKTVQYGTGPELWQELSWPGEQPMQGAAFTLSGVNLAGNRIEEPGVWGLMRLLERGKVERTSDQTFRVEWPVDLHQGRFQVVMEFRPNRVDSPFFGPTTAGSPRLLGVLRQLATAPPPQLTASGAPCGP